MARKILIAVALIIAVFPYLGFSEVVDVAVSTTLGFLMAAVLLLSRKPKTRDLSSSDDLPAHRTDDTSAPSQDLPIAHAEESAIEHRMPIVHEEMRRDSSAQRNTVSQVAQSTLSTNSEIVVKKPKLSKRPSEEKIPEIADGIILPTRKSRKHAPKVVLAYEEQVHPADVPIPADVQASLHLQERA